MLGISEKNISVLVGQNTLQRSGFVCVCVCVLCPSSICFYAETLKVAGVKVTHKLSHARYNFSNWIALLIGWFVWRRMCKSANKPARKTFQLRHAICSFYDPECLENITFAWLSESIYNRSKTLCYGCHSVNKFFTSNNTNSISCGVFVWRSFSEISANPIILYCPSLEKYVAIFCHNSKLTSCCCRQSP